MTRQLYILCLLVFFRSISFSQNSFDYTINFQPIDIPNLSGIHSYAHAQQNGKWLIIGGRLDGIHARQPFNAFPLAQNNTDIYVIDINTEQFWTASLNSLPTSLKEQLQSTNMNFYQDNDTLYVIGGYAFSETANDHITFPNLTSIQVSSLINAVINGTSVNDSFKQITDTVFAVTGGALGKIENTFLLVGGQKFDGRYNPMGGPSYIQTYTNQIRKFTIDNSGEQLSFSNLSAITDPVHLRRRDYNLLPQIFPDGEEGYTISSGVFQIDVDLPFLYPVDISSSAYAPITTFNQYLSNYHSATAYLYDSVVNEMHSLFFGGISQYYYDNGTLIQDDLVPFVKTVSRLTRLSNGTLQEYQFSVEMPGLLGASAEFLPNVNLPHFDSHIIKLSQISQDTILLGYIFGGISSPTLNPFSNNQTNTTSAENTIYAVRLIRNTSTGVQLIDGKNPFDINVFPNPVGNEFQVYFNLKTLTKVNYYVTNTQGQIVDQGELEGMQIGDNKYIIQLNNIASNQALLVTFVFDDKFFSTKKVMTK